MSFWRLVIQPLRRVSKMRQKALGGKPPKNQATPREIGDEEQIPK